jgi:cyclomaltodextrinase
MNRPADNVPEFVFGHLSTLEGRLARAHFVQEGFYHDLMLEPADPRPGEDVVVHARAGAHVTIDAATLYYTVDSADPEPGATNTCSVPMARTVVEWDTLTWSYGEVWSAVIPGQADGVEVRYVVHGHTPTGEMLRSPYVSPPPQIVTDEDEQTLRMTLETRARMAAPRVYAYIVDNERQPAWLREAVIYQIFVDRFAPDPGSEFVQPSDRNGIYGGTLTGIRSKLDYLAELGITCLWLTPIFPTPSHHGYDATDYGTVEPRLGDLDEFRKLTDAAHALGMRVVLDYVANHISNEHPAFVAAQQDSDAPTTSWFRFSEWPNEYDTFLGVRSMPRIATDDPGAREYLIDNACEWLERGADGFRLDHAHGATHAFWSAFRQATRAAKPDSASFGEITDTPQYVRTFTGRMDGALDFGLLEALRGFFAFGALAPSEFDRFLRRHFAYFGAELTLPSFLDNHDMNRFLFSVGGDVRKLKLAALCQFTLPGPPIVYYGTEVGLSQLQPADPLEEARLPMLWGDAQDAELLAYFKRLTALRREGYPAWCEERRTLLVDDARGVYAYACGDYVIVLNNSAQPTNVELQHANSAQTEIVHLTDSGADFDTRMGIANLPSYAGLAICNTRMQ